MLILCYHGISQDDEHKALDELYLSGELFRNRMLALRRGDYHVVSLEKALEGLASGTLPPRSVALTFDDGFVDFSRVALPILREFEYPATVYVTTEYVETGFPVFPSILGYILWKARGREEDGRGILADGGPIRTRTAQDRSTTFARLLATVRDHGAMSPSQCDKFADVLAERLGVDYALIKQRRLFQLMNREELAALDRNLVDIQLHTHRHVQPRDQSLFAREIADNRNALSAAGICASELRHFCYPNGEVRPELPGWLREQGVRSATTCIPGIAEHDSNPLLIPRFVDTQYVSPLKFEAWTCGAAALLPQRS